LKKITGFSIILTGFTAMASQIVFMRELLVVFCGNEISMGFILASWLIWGAFGSGILGRLAVKIKAKAYAFAVCQFALSILLPLSVLAIRWLKEIINIGPGEMIGFLPMAVSGLVILAPVCTLLGFMFSLGCRLYERTVRDLAGRIGSVYLLEAIGSLAGGLLVSLIFLRMLKPVEIIGILSLANISAAVFLLLSSRELKIRVVHLAIFVLPLVAAVYFFFFGGWSRLEFYSLKKQWKGYNLLAAKNSIYGNIVLTKSNDQVSFFDNGLHLYTVPDQLTSEQAVHFTLLEHPFPQEVLIVGGGVGGLVEEALKHPLKKVEYIELDPLIISLAKIYLDKIYYSPLEDRRTQIKNLDGRFFIKTTEKKYDCIIIHLGDPLTAQLNRYYTVEFFQEANKVLKEGGILSFALTASENYISPEQRDFLGSIYASLNKSFNDVKVFPGDTAYFLASNKKGILTYDYKLLIQRALERKLDLKYVREYYLFSNLSPERIAYLENSLGANQSVNLNYDFRPISYYYGMTFWSTYFQNRFLKKIFAAAKEDKIWKIILGLGAIFSLYLLFKRSSKKSKATILIAVAVTGFSEIVLQVLILITFQIIYGYLFYKLGVIITFFMLGLVLGSFLMVRRDYPLKKNLQVFVRIQLGLAIYTLVLPLIFWWLAETKDTVSSWIGANIIFILLPTVAGFLGGLQFPLANKIYLAEKGEEGKSTGVIYGIDLFGSCLGALFSGVFLIPLLGIPKTCLVLAVMNSMVLSWVLLGRKNLLPQ